MTDYKKKYKEALERAKQIQSTPYTAHWDVMKDVVEDIFPELKESEDEKIRKEMIFYFNKEIPQCSIQEHADKMKEFVAWLEKLNLDIDLDGVKMKAYNQGYAHAKEEQKPAWSEENDQMIKNVQNDYHNRLGAGIIPQAYHDKIIKED